MQLARVKGNIVATQKNKHLVGHKLLLVHSTDVHGNLQGSRDVIALDLVDAGIGDLVLVVQEGDAVQQMLNSKSVPVNTMIIAVIDNIELREEEKS